MVVTLGYRPTRHSMVWLRISGDKSSIVYDPGLVSDVVSRYRATTKAVGGTDFDRMDNTAVFATVVKGCRFVCRRKRR